MTSADPDSHPTPRVQSQVGFHGVPRSWSPWVVPGRIGIPGDDGSLGWDVRDPPVATGSPRTVGDDQGMSSCVDGGSYVEGVRDPRVRHGPSNVTRNSGCDVDPRA